jgi:ribonucleoside-diphosphate reductase alpha chain
MTHLSLSDNGRRVLEKRYLIKDSHGAVLETPEHLFRRVARFIAEGDFQYGRGEKDVAALEERFYHLLASLAFLPNSPTLMNADRPLGQLSACFVLPIEDSLESIFETLKHAALIHQSGGGTGFSFSRIRPRDDVVRSSMGVSSGPVSFMEVYNAATEAIKQGGTRRGANMGILRVDHPDIEAFIHCKQDLTRITNFNISVAVTDAFMQAVEAHTDYALIHPVSGETVRRVSARGVFNQIVQSAWQTGEPGLIFIDRINADNPTPAQGQIESTNPCGEVPLLPYEACNLGSINLGQMLTREGKLDWERLADTTACVTHFLDNVITQNRYPIPQIKAVVDGNRKIGMGVMGWADLLIALEIPYDSEEAVELARDVAAWMDWHAKKASVQLAKERGPFPNFAQSQFAQGTWMQEKHCQQPTGKVRAEDWQALDEEIRQHGLRNATTTCIAPTGTISIIAGASGGIEPLFSVIFERNVMDGTRMLEVHPRFEASALAHGFHQEALLKEIAHRGTLQPFTSEIPDGVRRVFKTAQDVDPVWHVRMQATFQEFCDNGVSKTINFEESAPPQAIEESYWLAYRLGVKGMTVYRNNSRLQQPMALATEKPTEHSQLCPDCHTKLQPGEGCLKCPLCAYSLCL